MKVTHSIRGRAFLSFPLSQNKTPPTLPDTKRVYRADLKRFRDRLCLREDGRCQVGIQSEVFKTEAG